MACNIIPHPSQIGVKRITKLTDRLTVLSHGSDKFSDQHKKGGNLNDY